MGIIAIIPARSGSKGLVNKNIKELCGKPLMAWTIMSAIESNCFDEIMVSTDSEEYATIAREYGANVPFLRSDIMSSDTASTWDTVREVISNYNLIGKSFDSVCLLQPTSPLRDSNDISSAIDFYKKKKANSVVSVCEMEHSISICNTLPEDGSLFGFFDSNRSGRRQDMKKYYRLNGAIYIQQTQLLMKCENIYGVNSYAYIMDKVSSIDIDDEVDFICAESLIDRFKNKSGRK